MVTTENDDVKILDFLTDVGQDMNYGDADRVKGFLHKEDFHLLQYFSGKDHGFLLYSFHKVKECKQDIIETIEQFKLVINEGVSVEILKSSIEALHQVLIMIAGIELFEEGKRK